MADLNETHSYLRDPDYIMGDTLRPDNSTPFPLGWLIFSIILIIIIVILLYFYYRQRTQLVEPSRTPSIRARFAAVPGVDKEPLNSCSDVNGGGQKPCISNATTLAKAIEYCDLNYKICTEFVYDPVSQTVKITNPSGSRSSSQQGNLYLLQIGSISVIS